MTSSRHLKMLAVAAALAAATAVVALKVRAAHAPAPAPIAQPALTVSTERPQTTVLPSRISANGSVAAWQEASIGSEANGLRLASVLVNVGDAVQRGQVLARFRLRQCRRIWRN